MLFGIDDLDPNFGPTIEVLDDCMKFDTKNKLNIVKDIHCLDSGQISFKTETYTLIIHKS